MLFVKMEITCAGQSGLSWPAFGPFFWALLSHPAPSWSSFCSLIVPKSLNPTYLTTERAHMHFKTPSLCLHLCNTHADKPNQHINYMGIIETWFCSVRDVTSRVWLYCTQIRLVMRLFLHQSK